MQSISVVTSQNVRINYKIASVGDRIIATIIDGIIVAAYLFLVTMILISNDVTDEWTYIILILPYPFYHLLCELFLDGQSIGKKAMNIKVIALDGSRPTAGMFFIRWVLRLIDIAFFSGVVALVVVLANGKGQRLGDIAAGTAVIKLEQVVENGSQVKHTFNENHEVNYSESIRLTDSDIDLIDQVLAFNKNEGNSGPAKLLAEKLAVKMGVTLNVPPVKFLHDVKKDYYHLTSEN